MNIRATAELWHKGDWFIAKLPELNFIAQGRIRVGENSQEYEKKLIWRNINI